jgi:hypothetical protein
VASVNIVQETYQGNRYARQMNSREISVLDILDYLRKRAMSMALYLSPDRSPLFNPQTNPGSHSEVLNRGGQIAFRRDLCQLCTCPMGSAGDYRTNDYPVHPLNPIAITQDAVAISGQLHRLRRVSSPAT